MWTHWRAGKITFNSNPRIHSNTNIAQRFSLCLSWKPLPCLSNLKFSSFSSFYSNVEFCGCFRFCEFSGLMQSLGVFNELKEMPRLFLCKTLCKSLVTHRLISCLYKWCETLHFGCFPAEPFSDASHYFVTDLFLLHSCKQYVNTERHAVH